MNRSIIRENNIRVRDYFFDILRGRTLYRKTRVKNLLTHDMLAIEPDISETDSVFLFDGIDIEDYDDEEPLKPGTNFDPDTGDIYE